MTQLQVLDVPNDPETRGRLHGEAFGPLAKRNLAAYLARYAKADATTAKVLEEGEAWNAFLAGRWPEYHAECAALANAAGMSQTEIAVLNARYELTYRVIADAAEAASNSAAGCTAFIATPETTKDGTMLAGQNWDWLATIRGGCFLLRAEAAEGRSGFIALTQAGVPGGMLGMNTSGLSLLVNGMTADGDGAGPLKTPHHVRVRRILEATTMTDALRAIFDEDRMCSTNYVLAHADGDAINVEAARDRAAYIYPKDGVLTHANHFEKLANVTSTFEKAHPSTLFRAERLKRLMQTANAGIDSKLMRELLGDCFGAPDSICWLPDERAPLEDRLMTIASIVMDLSAGVLWASEGPSVVNTHVPFAVAA